MGPGMNAHKRLRIGGHNDYHGETPGEVNTLGSGCALQDGGGVLKTHHSLKRPKRHDASVAAAANCRHDARLISLLS